MNKEMKRQYSLTVRRLPWHVRLFGTWDEWAVYREAMKHADTKQLADHLGSQRMFGASSC